MCQLYIQLFTEIVTYLRIFCSAQSKARISSSLRQVWAKRLKWKRLAEKFYSSWAESIAEAARRGGINEEELNWHSYQTLKKEIALHQRQHAAEKAKKKEMEKIHLPTSKQRGTLTGRTRDEKLKLSASRELNNGKAILRKVSDYFWFTIMWTLCS